MVRYERMHFIRAPIDRVFAFATHPKNLPRWAPEVVSSEKVTDGPIEVGTRLKQTRRDGKREYASETEVIAHEPPSRHAVRTRVHGLEATFTFTFTPEAPGTRVRLTAVVEGRGLRRFFEKSIGRRMEQADNEILVRLARAVEGT